MALPTLLRPALRCLNAQRHAPLRCTAASPCSMSSGSAVVDQMLSYVWGDLKGQGQPAIDVLRSGLSMQPDPRKGVDSARLNLALSEVFAAEHNWAQAAESSQAAAAAEAAAAAAAAAEAPLQAAAASLAGVGGLQAVRALLVSGRDADAIKFISNSTSSSVGVAQLAQQLMVQHASGGDIGELHQQLHESLHRDIRSGGNDRLAAVLLALGHKVAADAALATGSFEHAASSYEAAGSALGVTSSSSSSDTGSSGTFQYDASAGVSARLQHEVAADIALGAAQVHMFQRQWEAAEDQLSSALRSAEAAAGEANPMLAPVLLLLATGYARQARVMFAEGMLRECAKLLGGTEPPRLVEKSSSSSSHQAVHPSLTAALCWRYCQLLTALPNRSAEAAAWQDAARHLWAKAGGVGSVSSGSAESGAGFSIDAILGDDVALKGQGQHGHGRGAVVSLFLRRLLPVHHMQQQQQTM